MLKQISKFSVVDVIYINGSGICRLLTKVKRCCRYNNNKTMASAFAGHDDNSNQNLRIAVEGNIGSGKSTFLKQFQAHPEVQIVQEPVHLWQNVHGVNLLDMMYNDANRWSFTLQTYVQLTMVQVHLQEQTVPFKMMERSIYSDTYCFVENLFRMRIMSEIDYVVLKEWFHWLVQNLDLKLDLIVYLRTTPEVVYDRVAQRRRPEEQGITLDYLKGLHNLHEDWLVTGNSFPPPPCPVLTLDGDLPNDMLRERLNGTVLAKVIEQSDRLKKCEEKEGE